MSKALSARENRELEKDIENVGIPCEERRIRTPSVACVHQEEDSPLLPELIRGGHYLHNRHVCAVLGCPHAPYREVEKLLDKAEYCINPFPVLVKGPEEEICRIVKMDPIMKNRSYCSVEMKVADLYSRPESALLYGDGKESGYPLNKILLGVTYLIAAETGQLNGSRPKGSKNQIISEYLQDNPDGSVTIELPELLTPLLIHSNGFGVLVGPQNPAVYRKLIQRCPESPYKIRVRKIKEEDLQ